MSKVLILKGLPASGKSTFAKKLVGGDIKAMGNGWKRVNKDDLRAMLDDSFWSKDNEKFVILLRNYIIQEALASDYNVVVDDTNLNPQHEKDIRALVEKHGHAVDTKFFDVTVEECIKRDLKRPVSVGERVIKNMYNQFLGETPITHPGVDRNHYVPLLDKPDAIIVDIDGTLAHMVDRGPYDFHMAHTDSLDEIVAHVVRTYKDLGYKVIVCSGRDDSPESKEITENWLAKHKVPYDILLMRDRTRVTEKGGKVPDNIVKREIFDTHIRDNYNVRFVLDDRDRVVKMWRNELGLKVLQVAEGSF